MKNFFKTSSIKDGIDGRGMNTSYTEARPLIIGCLIGWGIILIVCLMGAN